MLYMLCFVYIYIHTHYDFISFYSRKHWICLLASRMLTLTATINNNKLNNFLILDLYYRQLRARIEAIKERDMFFFLSYATNSTNLFPHSNFLFENCTLENVYIYKIKFHYHSFPCLCIILEILDSSGW